MEYIVIYDYDMLHRRRPEKLLKFDERYERVPATICRGSVL